MCRQYANHDYDGSDPDCPRDCANDAWQVAALDRLDAMADVYALPR